MRASVGTGLQGLAVRRMRAGEVDAVRRFLAAHAPAGRPPHRPGWFEWQYVDNPDGCDVRVCCTGARLVAASGFIPFALTLGGVRRSGAFATNTLVAPAFRRRGLGRAIHEARAADYDVALSSGQSGANARVYGNVGAVVVGGYRQCLAQTTPPLHRPRPRVAREVASWLRWRMAAQPPSGLRVRIEDAVPDVPNSCYAARFGDGSVGPIWTPEHVAWRYARHPYFEHRFATVFRAREKIGFAVLRPKAGGHTLVDLYAPHADQADVLRAVAHAAGPVGGLFTGEVLDRVFRAAGWTTWRASHRLLGRSNDPVLQRSLSERSWCFFGGDSDTDR